MKDRVFVAAVELNRVAIATEEVGMSATAGERLDALEEKIIGWSTDESMIWDRQSEEASQYLQVVDEIRLLTEELESSLSNTEDGGGGGGGGDACLLHRAESTLQMAMARLEEEFAHLLIQYQQPVEPERMSFRSIEDDFGDDSSSSFDEEPIEGRAQVDSSRGSEGFVIDLIHPDAIFDLRCIAEIMFLSNYDKECMQAYVGIRKDALDEYLMILGMERLSIEDILRMDWSVLNRMIKRWNWEMKVFVRVYLASEKRLLDLLFGEFSGLIRESCFLEISKGSIMQLLNFGEAIALGPPKPEKLFRILDMYEGLGDLLADIEALFPEESCFCIITECREVSQRLGEFVRGTLTEFKSAIHNNTSTTPFAGGGVHPLTKYVMNYTKALTAYSGTLISIFGNQNGKGSKSFQEYDEKTSLCFSPMVHQLQSITSILEANLEGRSMLYKDSALKSFFLMNNICYMVQKVKDSDLRGFIGDEWIRAHNWKFQHYAISYERASWSLVLSFLKDEGICSHGSTSHSRTVLKERFKRFNLAFEEVYRAQTAWLIPDLELREDLRISVSLKVLQAYRTFMGRYSSNLDGVTNRDRYIKYWPEDLENYLLDLFGGSPKTLLQPRQLTNIRHLHLIAAKARHAKILPM